MSRRQDFRAGSAVEVSRRLHEVLLGVERNAHARVAERNVGTGLKRDSEFVVDLQLSGAQRRGRGTRTFVDEEEQARAGADVGLNRTQIGRASCRERVYACV